MWARDSCRSQSPPSREVSRCCSTVVYSQLTPLGAGMDTGTMPDLTAYATSLETSFGGGGGNRTPVQKPLPSHSHDGNSTVHTWPTVASAAAEGPVVGPISSANDVARRIGQDRLYSFVRATFYSERTNTRSRIPMVGSPVTCLECVCGGSWWTRTTDQRIKSPLL